jgi:hypothetical protein
LYFVILTVAFTLIKGILFLIPATFLPRDPFAKPNNVVFFINVKHREALKTGDPSSKTGDSIPTNQVFTDRSGHTIEQLWVLEATGVKSRYRIRLTSFCRFSSCALWTEKIMIIL